MRVYRLRGAYDPDVVEACLRALDAQEFPSPVEAGDATEEGIRVVRLELVERRGAALRALVRVSYKLSGRRVWSDLYQLELAPHAGELEAVVRRISGVGRTDPDFLVDALMRSLTKLARQTGEALTSR